MNNCTEVADIKAILPPEIEEIIQLDSQNKWTTIEDILNALNEQVDAVVNDPRNVVAERAQQDYDEYVMRLAHVMGIRKTFLEWWELNSVDKIRQN
jgi:hypothetical protein